MVTKTKIDFSTGIDITGSVVSFVSYNYSSNYVRSSSRPYTAINGRTLSLYRVGDTFVSLKSAGGTRSRADSSTVLCCGVPEPTTAYSDIDNDARNSAVSSLRSRLNKTEVNLGQNIVESHQVWNSIRSNMLAIARCRRMLKNGNVIAAAESLGLGVGDIRGSKAGFKPTPKNVSNRWLELQFGWLPLLSDVYNSTVLLNSRVKRTFYTISGSSTKTKFTTSTSNWSTPYSCLRGFEEQYSSQCLYKFTVIVSDPALRDLAQWGLTNPLELAWELLPFSFVVDWFLPIGNYFSQLSSTHGLSLSDGRLMQRRKSTVVVRYSKSPSSSAEVYGMATKSYLGLVRTPQGSLPGPRLPRLRNPLSALHIADSVALIVQRLR